ncbi:MAG: hypothetical protein M0R51_05240 [Clostridia bacterium]|jgi:hypothetical protein|nr:hypothetical protein [Clostridia bacterium]
MGIIKNFFEWKYWGPTIFFMYLIALLIASYLIQHTLDLGTQATGVPFTAMCELNVTSIQGTEYTSLLPAHLLPIMSIKTLCIGFVCGMLWGRSSQ